MMMTTPPPLLSSLLAILFITIRTVDGTVTNFYDVSVMADLSGDNKGDGFSRSAAVLMAHTVMIEDTQPVGLSGDQWPYKITGRTFDITLLYNDTAHKPANASRIAYKLLKSRSVLAFIGPTTSSESIPVGLLSSSVYQRPVISPSATASTLSSSTYFSSFCRLVPPDTDQAKHLVALALHFEWTKVAVIYRGDIYGTAFHEVFAAEAKRRGVRVAASLRYSTAISGEGTSAALTARDRVKSMLRTTFVDQEAPAHAILLIAFTIDAQHILLAARQLGLAGPGARSQLFAWIGTDGWLGKGVYDLHTDNQIGNSQLGDVKMAIRGVVGTQPAQAPGALAEWYKTKYAGSIDTDFMGQWPESSTTYYGNATSWAPYAFESYWTLARATQAVLDAGHNPANATWLRDAIVAQRYNGLTGEVRFRDNCDRIGDYDIMNIQRDPSSGELSTKRAGTTTEGSEGDITLALNAGFTFQFADGTSTPPQSSDSKPRNYLVVVIVVSAAAVFALLFVTFLAHRYHEQADMLEQETVLLRRASTGQLEPSDAATYMDDLLSSPFRRILKVASSLHRRFNVLFLGCFYVPNSTDQQLVDDLLSNLMKAPQTTMHSPDMLHNAIAGGGLDHLGAGQKKWLQSELMRKSYVKSRKRSTTSLIARSQQSTFTEIPAAAAATATSDDDADATATTPTATASKAVLLATSSRPDIRRAVSSSSAAEQAQAQAQAMGTDAEIGNIINYPGFSFNPKRRKSLDEAVKAKTIGRRALIALISTDRLLKYTLHWDFSVLYMAKHEHMYLQLGSVMQAVGTSLVTKLGIMERMDGDDAYVLNLLKAIRGGYHDNPFHNQYHGADVAHSLACLLIQSRLIDHLEAEEVLAVIIAGLCHDYDHLGVNNHFLVHTEHELSLLYNDMSVLENHHAASCIKLLREPQNNVFAFLPQQSQKSIYEIIVKLILATDLKHHFEVINEFETRVKAGHLQTVLAKSEIQHRLSHSDSSHHNHSGSTGIGNGNDVSMSNLKFRTHTFSSAATLLTSASHSHVEEKELDHVDLMVGLKMAIKCADLGHPAKRWAEHEDWSARITEEMHQQGDKERELGMEVSPFMDRTQASAVAKSQLDFFDFLIIPMWKPFADLYQPCAPCMTHIRTNRDIWLKTARGKRVQPEMKSAMGVVMGVDGGGGGGVVDVASAAIPSTNSARALSTTERRRMMLQPRRSESSLS